MNLSVRVQIRMGLVSHDQEKNQALCKVHILQVSSLYDNRVQCRDRCCLDKHYALLAYDGCQWRKQYQVSPGTSIIEHEKLLKVGTVSPKNMWPNLPI